MQLKTCIYFLVLLVNFVQLQFHIYKLCILATLPSPAFISTPLLQRPINLFPLFTDVLLD